MRRAAVNVDVQAVRRVRGDIGVRAQRIEDAFRDHPGAAVGAVKADPHALVGVGGQANEIADVAVAPGGVIDSAADALAMGEGQLAHFAVEIFFDLVEDGFLHFLALTVQELYAVVVIRVVAGADHYAAVEIVHAGDIGDAGRRGDVQQIGVGARGRKTGGQRALVHIAGAAGVLSDDYFGAAFFAVIPAEKAAYFICVVGG